MTEEYYDGDFEYDLVESLVELIIDKYGMNAHIYLECDKFDDVRATTMAPDSIKDPDFDAIAVNALMHTVAYMLSGKTKDERNALIALIYESINNGIHLSLDYEESEEEDNSDFE